jgi:gamma-glutamylcyclotransferase (GGCT)/AIG2-like uncharacterized protein YtfP
MAEGAMFHPLTRRLPFFVYGTLQTGYANHASLFEGLDIYVQSAKLQSASLYHLNGFPGMKPSETGNFACGQLITILGSEEAYRTTTKNLDTLEDYFGPDDRRNWYQRSLVSVAVDDDTMSEAWTYWYYSFSSLFALVNLNAGTFGH